MLDRSKHQFYAQTTATVSRVNENDTQSEIKQIRYSLTEKENHFAEIGLFRSHTHADHPKHKIGKI